MQTNLLGVLLILLSHCLNSFNKVWYSDISAYVDPMVYALFGYGSAIVFFWIFGRKSAPIDWRHRKHWWNINISSALTFVCFLYALKFVDPVIVSSIESGLLVLFMLFLGRNETAITPKVFGYGVAIFALTLASCYFSDGVREMDVLGVGLAVLTSLGVAFIIRHQKALTVLGYPSHVVMKHRFYLITLVAAASVWFDTGQFPISVMAQKVSIELVVVAFLGSTLCLYLIQQGVARCSLSMSSALMAAMPVVTFIVNYAYSGGSVNVPQCIAIMLLALSLVLFSIQSQRQIVKQCPAT